MSRWYAKILLYLDYDDYSRASIGYVRTGVIPRSLLRKWSLSSAGTSMEQFSGCVCAMWILFIREFTRRMFGTKMSSIICRRDARDYDIEWWEWGKKSVTTYFSIRRYCRLFNKFLVARISSLATRKNIVAVGSLEYVDEYKISPPKNRVPVGRDTYFFHKPCDIDYGII